MASGVLLWEFLLQSQPPEILQGEKIEKIIEQKSFDNSDYQNQIVDLKTEVRVLTEKLNIAEDRLSKKISQRSKEK